MPNDTSMNGKVCLVTGGSTGIGLVAAVELAKRGAAVTIVARNPERAAAALARIKAESGADAELILADLSSMKEVRRAAAEFRAKHDRLDVLLNNAGVILSKRELTADGYESTFAINHLAYFLLTELLLGLLKKSAPSRIVEVSSGAHMRGHMNFDDLMGARGYSEMGSYCQSKLANVLHTVELAKRMEGTGVTVNALHPGVVATRWGAGTTGPLGVMLKLMRPFILTPERGAETSIYLATSPEVAGVSGDYFYKCKPKATSREARDPAAAKRLWEVSEKLVQAA